MVGVVLGFVVAMTLAAAAQATSSTMTNFNNYNGAYPYAGLIQGADGNFYGTTLFGGTRNVGTVYKVTPYGVPRTNQSVVYSFTPYGPDGNEPAGPLLWGSDGNLYGTAYQGGDGICGSPNVGCGTVFQINPSTGAEFTVHTFAISNSDGINPISGLIQSPAGGPLFGTASNGGANGYGMIFSVNLDGSGYTDLYDFCPVAGCADGANPEAGLVADASGNLYGTTVYGGASGYGVVYELVASTGYTYTVLYSFAGSPDGANPFAPLVLGPDGDLYGTTAYGGTAGYGTVFKTSIHHIPPVTLVIHSFQDDPSAIPFGPLLLAADGYFYGTTYYGGPNDEGTVFRISAPFGTVYESIFSFAGSPNGGAYPESGLVQATNGYLYGTAQGGGNFGDGVVFTLSPVREEFIPVTPCRLLDTRSGTPLLGMATTNFNVQTLAADNCGYDLSYASSYALNVTIIPDYGPVGYITVYPANSPQGVPLTSTLNAYDEQIKAALPFVLGGWDTGARAPSEAIGIYASNETDVLVDLQGFFTEQPALQFYPTGPCRVVDTRGSNGPLGGPSLVGNMPRLFPMMASPCFANLGGAPPVAYELNLTALPSNGQPLYYLTAWQGGQPQPDVSNLNSLSGTVVANAAIVQAGAGADGAISVYASNNTDFIIDVNGYWNPPGADGINYYPGLPCRSVDTRPITGGTGFTGTYEANVAASVCTPFSLLTPAAYDLNATVVPYGAMDFLTLWSVGQPQPVVSTLNAYNGSVTSNMAIVPNTNNVGVINGYASGPSFTDLLLDLSGYFAPSVPGGGGGNGGGGGGGGQKRGEQRPKQLGLHVIGAK
jgi:uncharacterized repeat protein (TIGR03803 family)